MTTWDSYHCEVQGLGHRRLGTPCQDKTSSACAGDCRVIVLADGAGSARLSHEGAAHIAQATAAFFAHRFSRLWETEDADAVRTELAEFLQGELYSMAIARGCKERDLASTLLVAAVCGERFLLLHLGDGVIAYRRKGRICTASAPDNGEYANCTHFTTSPRLVQHLRLYKGMLRGIDGFVLMSDGSAASLYNKRQKCPAPVLGHLMDSCTWLPADRVEQLVRRGLEEGVVPATTDDCSLAVLAARDPQFRGLQHLPHPVLCRIFGLPAGRASSRSRLRRYLRLLNCLQRPLSPAIAARRAHIHPRRLYRTLNHLRACGLLEQAPHGCLTTPVRRGEPCTQTPA